MCIRDSLYDGLLDGTDQRGIFAAFRPENLLFDDGHIDHKMCIRDRRHGVQGLLKDEVIDLTEALDAPGKLSLLRHTPASYLGLSLIHIL